MTSLQTFLRRTAASAGAIAALMVMGPATSQTVPTVTLSGATGNSCPYSEMRVSPSGDFTVTCGSSTSSGPGTFSVVAPAQLVTNTTSSTAVSVRRSGGSTGVVIVAYNVVSVPLSCIEHSGTLTFAEGSTSQPIVVQATGVTGTCTVSITPSPPGIPGSPTSTPITIVGPAPPPVAGCPVETTAGTLGSSGFVNDVRLASGAIGTFALPALDVSTMANIGLYYTAQSAPNTANGAYFSIEMHINKCKGLVQPTTTSSCYGVVTNPVGGEIKWLTAFTAKYTTEAIATSAGFCYAPASEGPWYFNIRYNYPGGCKGTPTCGWHATWRPLN